LALSNEHLKELAASMKTPR